MATVWHGDWDVRLFNGGLKVAGNAYREYFIGNSDRIDHQLNPFAQVCRDLVFHFRMAVRVAECQGASVALEFPPGWTKLGHRVDESFL